MREVVFHRETFDGFYPECLPLVQAHNDAVEGADEKLSISDALYREAETNGGLRIYAARALDANKEPGRLVGYVAFLLFRDPHHGHYIAAADAFYVEPEYRIGRTLIQFADKELAGEGVERVHHEVRPSHPELATMLRYLDYLPVSAIFGKTLTKERVN